MRVDPRTIEKQGSPKIEPWDNQGLRDRLQGSEVATPGVDTLQTLVRERNETSDRKRRLRRA